MDELDVYDIIRFKAEKFEMFDNWCKKARSNENNDKDRVLELIELANEELQKLKII